MEFKQAGPPWIASAIFEIQRHQKSGASPFELRASEFFGHVVVLGVCPEMMERAWNLSKTQFERLRIEGPTQVKSSSELKIVLPAKNQPAAYCKL
ncbi:unnamed protein product [Caenorhabditis brenneri]